MSDGETIERHCANCMGYSETHRAWDPLDRVYWVCGNCHPRVESGEAECVLRNEYEPE